MSAASSAQSAYQAPGQENFRNRPRGRFGIYGFTLVELLVVIAVIAILAAMLFPVFATTKESGRRTRCALQLKQLVQAVISYADDNNGHYVPAASDIAGSNLCRWHGTRTSTNANSSFDPTKGPLWKYMGRSGGLKECPTLVNTANGFELGGGGFGYNQFYVGGTYYRNWGPEADQIASATSDIAHPSMTIMFADTAMAASPTKSVIEYSFAEPPYKVSPDGPGIATTSPSIHFRHNGMANVGWCDGHISLQRMRWTAPGKNIYRCNNKAFALGWFGPEDNRLFDNK
ncbi:prepilin-type N-terminal cleavage/methylation domain-containing protein [bacterium]|nr:prepilin-type N-terminal cleavage/methylation domain-containing protein [bacterium]